MQCTAEKAVTLILKEVVNGESYIELSPKKKNVWKKRCIKKNRFGEIWKNNRIEKCDHKEKI